MKIKDFYRDELYLGDLLRDRISYLSDGVELYICTDDVEITPHFHVRKLKDEEVLFDVGVKIDSADYIEHKNYRGSISDELTIELDTLLRKNNIPWCRHSEETYWERLLESWNRNNNDIQIDYEKSVQPDYSKLNK